MRCGRPTAHARYQWLYNTWGAGFKINNLYDGTFVLDEHFNVIWGSFQSQPFQETNLDFFGKGLKALIAQHARASGDKNIYAGISKTRSGVAFVGIGLIRPMVGRLQVTDGYAPLSGHYPSSERQNFIRPGVDLSDR
jgi:hypothetical protein